MDLKLPLDFERLPEFRQLAELCGGEVVASYLWVRLWVELGYAAGAGGAAGVLTAAAGRLYERSVPKPEGRFEEGYTGPLEWLVSAGLLKKGNAVDSRAEGWFCERFARLNGHLEASHVPMAQRCNRLSLLTRRQRQVEQEAAEQAMLIAPSCYRKRDGSEMGADLANAVRLLVINLDRALERPRRKPAEWSEGMMADAAAVVGQESEVERMKFLRWLYVNREHAAVPKTAEQILRQWEWVKGIAQ